jgi:hypothetical protein
MPHIQLPDDMPGITAESAIRPEAAEPMRELAQTLLHTSGREGAVLCRNWPRRPLCVTPPTAACLPNCRGPAWNSLRKPNRSTPVCPDFQGLKASLLRVTVKLSIQRNLVAGEATRSLSDSPSGQPFDS